LKFPVDAPLRSVNPHCAGEGAPFLMLPRDNAFDSRSITEVTRIPFEINKPIFLKTILLETAELMCTAGTFTTKQSLKQTTLSDHVFTRHSDDCTKRYGSTWES
jgi:hypothetical protein